MNIICPLTHILILIGVKGRLKKMQPNLAQVPPPNPPFLKGRFKKTHHISYSTLKDLLAKTNLNNI